MALLLMLPLASAAPRTSADYSIPAETADSGGSRASSAIYASDISIGQIAGVSENPSPLPSIHRSGFVGQLYELGNLGLIATDYFPAENSSTTLIPVRNADDGTKVALPTAGILWSVVAGPVGEIGPDGAVETLSVYQDTPAVVFADLGVEFAAITLRVRETLADNFNTYAADGIDDAWQFAYFGLDNPLAGRSQDPDGDGQDNLFEFVSGAIPSDPHSRFQTRIAPVAGQPHHKAISFSPYFPDRIYRLKANTVLTGPWTPVPSTSPFENGNERTFIDTGAAAPDKFYQIEITKP